MEKQMLYPPLHIQFFTVSNNKYNFVKYRWEKENFIIGLYNMYVDRLEHLHEEKLVNS